MSKQHEKPYNRIQALEATQERGVQLGRIDFSGDWQDRVDPSDLPREEDAEVFRGPYQFSDHTMLVQRTAIESLMARLHKKD